MNLIDRLKEIQAEEGLNGPKMAAILGMSPVTWSRKRNGRERLNLDDYHNIVLAYPYLAPLVFYTVIDGILSK